jgi:hypothetical protein
MPDDLQQIAPPAPEDINIPHVRITLQVFLDQQGQAGQ